MKTKVNAPLLAAWIVVNTALSLPAVAASPCCLQQRIVAGDPAPYDSFGRAVATSGDWVIIGAEWDDDLGTDSGSAYIFRRVGTTWSQAQKLLAPDGLGNNLFGSAVALDGTTAMVGAFGHMHPKALGWGAVYVYDFDGASWIHRQELLAPDGAPVDGFGYTVAIDGPTAIIGAPGHDAMGVQSGAAYIFRYHARSGQWVEEQKLLATDGQAGDLFGSSVAINGDVALVGSPLDDDGHVDAGTAYFFRYSPRTAQWVQEQKILPTGTLPQLLVADFGHSVALQGNAALIGAPFYGPGSSGGAFVFRHNGQAWVQEQRLLPPDTWSCQFGNAVALDSGKALVGSFCAAPYGPTGDVGAAYVYRYNAAQAADGQPPWNQHGPALMPAPTGGPFFGRAVGLHGSIVVVGAHGESQQRGAAYIYRIDPPAGDVNCDGVVNGFDIAVLLGQWTGVSTYSPCTPPQPADLNEDCKVNGMDLAILLGAWG